MLPVSKRAPTQEQGIITRFGGEVKTFLTNFSKFLNDHKLLDINDKRKIVNVINTFLDTQPNCSNLMMEVECDYFTKRVPTTVVLKKKVSCIGCRYNSPNQMAHTGVNGCLASKENDLT